METMTLNKAATTIKKINLTAKSLPASDRSGYLLGKALEVCAVRKAVRAAINRATDRGGSPRLVGTLVRELYADAEA